MINKEESVLLAAVLLVVLLIILPSMFETPSSDTSDESCEGFTAQQKMNISNGVSGSDPNFYGEKFIRPRGSSSDYEALIFDNARGTIESSSQFMRNTGIVAPLWIPPAWDPDALGPSSEGELNPADYENDPRMLYNKCSLSCCSPQYPTPFQGTVDPFVCDKDGKNKYLSSDYVCQNNTGGTGCLCMTEKQVDGLEHGFVNYYSNEKLGY